MILLEVRTMENIKLILCDLDGTLLNNESMVTDYTKAAIQKARDKGILFGVATGRSLYAVNQLIDKWQIRELCDKAIWIDNGALRMMGESNQVCDSYVSNSQKASREQLKNIEL